MTTQQAFALALQHHQAGRLAEAETLYRQILAIQPNHADTLHLLGVVAHQTGRHDLAMEWLRQAAVLAPNSPEVHSNLGEACRAMGRFDEAVACYRRALSLHPHYPEAHNNLGIALTAQGELDAAITACRRALQLQPDYPEAYNNLGNALARQGLFDEAVAAYNRALQLRPNYPEAFYNLGNALKDLGQLEEAVAAYRRAIELKPDYADAHGNLGTVLEEQGHLDSAIAEYRRALQIQPDHSSAQLNFSLLLLLRGDFEQGWPFYEARWAAFGYTEHHFSQPRWDGSMLDGRRILIHAEQGFGDAIQFIRYAPLIARRGGRVIVECQPGLKTLLTGMEGISQVVEQGEPLPAFDLHCPMMSLPLAFGTRVETIPATIPYLRADPIKAARWRERLDQETGMAGKRNPSQHRPLKVGLIWAGGVRPHQPNASVIDRRRSMRLGQFASLAGVPGVLFVSLQKGPPAAEAQTPPEGMTLLDWTDELHDFADTAALIEALDLVISVDTAGAHLAGALGQPVWVLNRFDACWRWLRDRTDSPWYPTMRLFRQPVPGDWDSVIQRVAEELSHMAKESALES